MGVRGDVDPIVPTLLRAPAAVIAGAYVVGLIIGESAKPLSAAPLSLAFYAGMALVLAPFVLPVRWFRRSPRILGAWMLAAAIVVTARAAFMAGWLFPRLPLTSWLTKLSLDLVLAAAMWIAALAARGWFVREETE
jgi:hypothetical protein